MNLQIRILSKGLGAKLALKWLFTSVCSIMTGQKGIISKLLGANLTLKRLITLVLSSVAKHFGLRARHERMLALGFFITMRSQVTHNSTLISGDISAGTASK
uniref:Putative homeobox transcription factor sip1 n=1 Tax=Ixodes ricinus TaxID=34613 RepID=A0A6B0U6T7_IXORI